MTPTQSQRLEIYRKRQQLTLFVSKGFFPKELIPAFNSSGLGKPIVLTALINHVKSNYQKKWTKPVAYSIPKIKHFRRTLGIPNPEPYCKLSYELVENWTSIKEITELSKFSISRLSWDNVKSRAIADPNFETYTAERILRSTSFRYSMHLDISRFYSSIYTHSIPWATMGKEEAKADLTSGYGNAIDKIITHMQHGQTIGIPTGPDTSRVISEIIASKIDSIISSQFGDLVGIRFVDDYIFFGDDLTELEKVQALVHSSLKSYELELNSDKIEIHKMPFVYTDNWVSKLKKFTIRKRPNNQKNDLIGYFSLAFTLSKTFEAEHVLPYAISRLKKVYIAPENIKTFQTLLIQAIFAEPKTISYVTHMILSHVDDSNSVDKETLKAFLQKFIVQQIALGNEHEISWALWLCCNLKIKLDAETTKRIVTVDNSIVALVTLDMFSKKLLTGKRVFPLWEAKMNAENLYSEHWLLAYEAHVKGWLMPSATYIDADRFFKILKRHNVSFYDNTAELSENHLERMDVEHSIPFKLKWTRQRRKAGAHINEITPPTITDLGL